MDDRPAWARRIKAERLARGWSQSNAINVLRAHSPDPLPADGSLMRNWKRWEAGDAEPDAFYKPLIAKAFGTVTAAMFPERRRLDAELLAETGLDTVEMMARLRASDVSTATLEALRITADRLCCDYPHAPALELRAEGVEWLKRITGLLDRRLTLAQHREVLSLAGLVALLVGCVEYDLGLRQNAEATREVALSLGRESDDSNVQAWAQEMKAWFALTQGDHRGVIVAAEAGEAVAPNHSVAVQLAAQRAKAWARLGDRRQVEIALDKGRNLLESLPHPTNLEHHFVVDPAKFDFYSMDCHRLLGNDNLAEVYARQVMLTGDRNPMRASEAHITLGIVAARNGDLEQAVAWGGKALEPGRRSLPHLVMNSRELRRLLEERYPNDPQTAAYADMISSTRDSYVRR